MPVDPEGSLRTEQPDWALVTNGRMPDGGPRYTETPADPYAPDAPRIAEPWNAVTAALFIVIVLVWIWRLRGRYRQFPFLMICMPILLAGGIGGTLYHALRTSRVYFLLDVIPISLLGLAGAVYLAVRLSKRWAWAYTLGALLVYVTVNRLIFSILPPQSIAWAVNISYASLAALVLTPIAIVLFRTRFRNGGWVVAGLISFVIAWFCRLLDTEAAELMTMGSHWLWHTFGAITTVLIVEYFYLVEAETPHRPVARAVSK